MSKLILVCHAHDEATVRSITRGSGAEVRVSPTETMPRCGEIWIWNDGEGQWDMGSLRPMVMTFCEDPPPEDDKCPKCASLLRVREYRELPDPKAYYDCLRCCITWEGFLAAPTEAAEVRRCLGQTEGDSACG